LSYPDPDREDRRRSLEAQKSLLEDIQKHLERGEKDAALTLIKASHFIITNALKTFDAVEA